MLGISLMPSSATEKGFIGGTGLEVEYVVSLGIPVQVHRGEGPSEWILHLSNFGMGNRPFYLPRRGFS
jgi:hypothetical protein